jgi:GNAT superfamily N-acetyltransferase
MPDAEQAGAVAIRRAESHDLDAVVALVRELAAFEKLPGPDEAAAARLRADFGANPPRYWLLVADRDGAIVGYALYFYCYSTFLAQPSLYLEDLYVRPAERGRGVGRAFMLRLAEEAVAHGCGRFEWTVLDWNVHAQRFYRGLGADVHAEWQLCRVTEPALSRLASSK